MRRRKNLAADPWATTEDLAKLNGIVSAMGDALVEIAEVLEALVEDGKRQRAAASLMVDAHRSLIEAVRIINRKVKAMEADA